MKELELNRRDFIAQYVVIKFAKKI